MSRADEVFIQNCRDILENGVWDTEQEVRQWVESRCEIEYCSSNHII